MKKIIAVLVVLTQINLAASAFFAKPRVKLNHDVRDENLIMAIDSGKKVTVEFHNVTVCPERDDCYTIVELSDSLDGTVKNIGYDLADELDIHDQQAHHTFETIYDAKPTTGYVYLKDAETNKTLHTIKVLVRGDDYCYEDPNKVKGKITFPEGDAYIMNFENMCELERAGATVYEK